MEKEGSFINCDGKERRFDKAFDPLKDSRPESRVLLELEGLLKGEPSESESRGALEGASK